MRWIWLWMLNCCKIKCIVCTAQLYRCMWIWLFVSRFFPATAAVNFWWWHPWYSCLITKIVAICSIIILDWYLVQFAAWFNVILQQNNMDLIFSQMREKRIKFSSRVRRGLNISVWSVWSYWSVCLLLVLFAFFPFSLIVGVWVWLRYVHGTTRWLCCYYHVLSVLKDFFKF